MFETLSLILIGVLLGTITGLTPGLHVNTVLVLLMSATPFIPDYLTVKEVVAFIVGMSVTHTFVDFIPAVLIGAPKEDSVLSVLPGHRMLMDGRGYEALRLTVLGGVGSILVATAVLPMALLVLPLVYANIRGVLPYILLIILAYMIATEKSKKRMTYACLLIICSGTLGLIILDHLSLSGMDALFPTLTGLFGLSTLVVSMKSSGEVPEQSLQYTPRILHFRRACQLFRRYIDWPPSWHRLFTKRPYSS